MPAGAGGSFGMTDADLWQRISTNGDVLGGLSFTEAVQGDPRRVDALVQKRVVRQFIDATGQAAGGLPATIARHAYLQGYEALRAQHGDITASVLADSLEGTWQDYQDFLSKALWPMARAGRPEAQKLQDAIIQHSDAIMRAFQESSAIAQRAAFVAASDADTAAWQRYDAVIRGMWQAISDHLAGLDIQLPDRPWTLQLPESQFGALFSPGPTPGDFGLFDAEDDEQYGLGLGESPYDYFLNSGHRAPWAGLPAWRRAGGRFYG